MRALRAGSMARAPLSSTKLGTIAQNVSPRIHAQPEIEWSRMHPFVMLMQVCATKSSPHRTVPRFRLSVR